MLTNIASPKKNKWLFIILIAGCLCLQSMSFLASYNYWQSTRKKMVAKSLIKKTMPQELIRIVNIAKRSTAQKINGRLKRISYPGLAINIAPNPLNNSPKITGHLTQNTAKELAARDYFAISIPLSNKQWLNVVKPKSKQDLLLLISLIATFVLITILLILLCIWIIRRFAAGTQQLVTNLINNRTQMLAAISHDLRTPITRLKLRIESFASAENYQKINADINEMEHMIASILSFAKNDYLTENLSKFDLSALIATICDDMIDLGHKVNYEFNEKIIFSGRINSLKRAITNLIENAIKYGDVATINLYKTTKFIYIKISDQGPGIPAEKISQALLPFVRLDHARSPKVLGSGLGLTVANDIIQAHNGTLELTNLKQGGLCAIIILPYV